jgi:tetratricopeptide (TPR) repeat protein
LPQAIGIVFSTRHAPGVTPGPTPRLRDWLLVGYSSVTAGDYETARSAFSKLDSTEKVVRLLRWAEGFKVAHPGSSVSNLLLGDALIRNGRTREAIGVLDDPQAAGITSAMIRNVRGIARALASEYDLARIDFDRAAELAPGFADPYCNKGLLELSAGAPAGAARLFGAALERAPRFGLAAEGLAAARLGALVQQRGVDGAYEHLLREAESGARAAQQWAGILSQALSSPAPPTPAAEIAAPPKAAPRPVPSRGRRISEQIDSLTDCYTWFWARTGYDALNALSFGTLARVDAQEDAGTWRWLGHSILIALGRVTDTITFGIQDHVYEAWTTEGPGPWSIGNGVLRAVADLLPVKDAVTAMDTRANAPDRWQAAFNAISKMAGLVILTRGSGRGDESPVPPETARSNIRRGVTANLNRLQGAAGEARIRELLQGADFFERLN